MPTSSRLLALLVLALASVAACSGAAPAGQSGSTSGVRISASEYHFDPSSATVDAGEVTFTVRNSGSVEHEFEILQGERVVDEIEGLVPGLERSIAVRLEAGTYVYVCRLPGHEQQGMKGALTVTGG